MVEAQENEAAVRMISELAKLLRVSLARGKTIIPIKAVSYTHLYQHECQTWNHYGTDG